MRFGYRTNKDLEGFDTLRDWLLNKIDEALLIAPEFEEIVFILPLTNTRFRISERTGLEPFRKKVKKCVALSSVATRNAKKLAGVI